MWPFRATAKFPELEERLKKLERELEAHVAHTKNAIRELDHDMDSLWDKVKHWTGRLAKRVAAAGQEASDTAAPPVVNGRDWNQTIRDMRSHRVPNRNS